MTDPTKPLILVVEDEAAQLDILLYNLEAAEFRVIGLEDGSAVIERVEEQQPDLIVLDWMLPGVSGINLCQQLKRSPRSKEIPILMLTAKGSEEDRLRGFNVGADDYLVKPYSTNELIARIRAILRRTRPGSIEKVLTYSDIYLDTERHRVTRADRTLRLGPTEYRLLLTLMERPDRVWSRAQLLDRVWGRDSDVDYRTVDVHIGRLRKELNKFGAPDIIRTIRGEGYALDEGRPDG